MFFDAFLYDTSHDLLYIDNRILCCGKENKPMDKRLIKLHKGVDNTVQFKVKDKDYKKVAVEHMTVGARMVNLENDELVLEKYLHPGTCKGLMCLNVLEGDLCDIPAGYYQLILTQEKPTFGNMPESAIHLPFYSDTGDNIFYNVEVTNQGHVAPRPSIEMDPNDWVPLNADREPYITYSSAVPANSIRNHKNSIHTFSFVADNFSGKLSLLGTLDANPPTDINQYFNIDIAPGVQDIEMDQYTGTTAFTIEANLSWVKFKLTYDPDIYNIEDNGTLEKLVWRS